MDKADSVFFKKFGAVLGLLAIFMFIAIFLGRGIAASAKHRGVDSKAATLERIKPVGQVNVAQAETPAPAGGAKAASEPPSVKGPMKGPMKERVASAAVTPGQSAKTAAGRSGEQIYHTVCMACHMTGILNAPKFGDKAAWTPRAANGVDALVQSAIKGKGAMPPKAGNPTLSDEEIARAVRFMLGKAGLPTG